MRQAITATIVIALVLVAMYGCRQWIRAAQERQFAEGEAREAQTIADEVRRGQKEVGVNVYCQEVLPAIAADAKCCAKVEELYFMMFDHDYDASFDYSPIAQLSQLRYMFFYCFDSDPVLRAVQGKESIEELRFELCGFSPEGLELLGTFPNLKRVAFAQDLSTKDIAMFKATLPNVQLLDPYAEDEAVQEQGLRADSKE